MTERILAWEGCKNVRDLGGLRTGDGRTTRWGAVVRSDTPSRLTDAGWSALYDYGIRTIITLRTHGMTEDELNVAPPYPDIAVIPIAIEDVTDMEFVRLYASSELWCTPLYYPDALRRWPERHAAVISAIAQAQPGGVLFHCIRGHDRTGIIAMLLLALVGVIPEDMAADYSLSVDPDRDAILASQKITVIDALLAALDGLDLDRYFCQAGATPGDLAALRARLLG